MADQPTKQDYFRLIHSLVHSYEEDEVTYTDRYYLKIFDQFGNKNFFIKWNWAAFLFGPYWLGYRRMYGLAIAFFVLFAIPFQIDDISILTKGSMSYYFVVLIHWMFEFLFLGLFGNAIYFMSLRKRIERKESAGGTNGWFIFVPLIALILALLIPWG